MSILVLFLVSTISDLTNCLFLPRPLPEDGRFNFTELSNKYGHKGENHSVTTEDGYILTVFRIPGKRKTPVLLTHGVFDTGDSFILRGNTSLAIVLANRGHDVWVSNTRGNKYSRRHTKLNPDTDPSFWDYSFHEHGYYDLAAITDYILNVTGEKQIQSIGHSEGTTDHFVLGSLRPEYNEKFKVFIALAPVAYLSNLPPPVNIVPELGPLINRFLLDSKIEELFNEKGVIRNIEKLVCNQGAISYALCGEFIFQFVGYDSQRFEAEFLPVIIGHYIASGSRKSILHYGQVALSKRFAQFDYGSEENQKRYGFLVPPDYNLREVTMKTALIVAKNDKFSPVRDVEYLRFLLPNIVKYHLLEPEEFNHLDFVWGNDINKTLFPHLLPLLEDAIQ